MTRRIPTVMLPGTPLPELRHSSDGTGCTHWFVLPTPQEGVACIGTCRTCGLQRVHSNVGKELWGAIGFGRDE